jgi:hypothetical protein
VWGGGGGGGGRREEGGREGGRGTHTVWLAPYCLTSISCDPLPFPRFCGPRALRGRLPTSCCPHLRSHPYVSNVHSYIIPFSRDAFPFQRSYEPGHEYVVKTWRENAPLAQPVFDFIRAGGS